MLYIEGRVYAINRAGRRHKDLSVMPLIGSRSERRKESAEISIPYIH